jgi:murein DD-endopeptidase MepM/ murein hydrolase activator NlpD
VNGWKSGTPIPSLSRGRVVRKIADAQNPRDLGNYITIRAFDGNTSKLRPERFSYCHLRDLDGTPSVGDTVPLGGYVGPLGSTGYSTGPHLHLMVSTTSDNPNTRAGIIDPYPYVVAARTSWSSGEVTPIDESEEIMKIIRNPNGQITAVGETTYQHYRTMSEYLTDATLYGAYRDVSAAGYTTIIANTQVRKAYLLAGITGGGGSSVDPAAIALKVEQQLADDFAHLEANIAAINTEIGVPTAEEIADAVVDEQAKRLQA